jgi:D-glycero-D-manno-heptose 1,7-bisphosphate phosphatase
MAPKVDPGARWDDATPKTPRVSNAKDSKLGSPKSSEALFLDRDGVINVDRRYVWRIEDFEFLPGIFELCRAAQTVGLLPVVVTNQAGIGRGYYTEQDFQTLTEWMLAQFRAHGISIGRVYHCPYHPTEGVGDYRRDSPDRKPKPGMILRAKEDLGLDLSRSVLVGHEDSDIEAGRAAGVGYNIKLLHSAEAQSSPDQLGFDTLHAIGDWLVRTFARSEPE